LPREGVGAGGRCRAAASAGGAAGRRQNHAADL